MDSKSSYSSSTRKQSKISTVVNCHSGVKNTIFALVPDEIQILILNKLDVVNFYRFTAVCRQWQSIAIAIEDKIRRQFLLKQQFPTWLMLSFSESSISTVVNCRHSGVKKTIFALLPDEIQILILNKLDVVEFYRFTAVCRGWQSIAIAIKIKGKIRRQFLFKQQFPPWLMLSFSKSESGDHHHGFFSLSQDKVFRLELPQIHGARCCGSNWGWLIMLGNQEGCMFLFNPFTRTRIQLPPKSTLPRLGPLPISYIIEKWEPKHNYIRKVMLLSPPPIAAAAASAANKNPNPEASSEAMGDDCWVAVIYMYRNLAFCRLGDESWTAKDFAKDFIGPDPGYDREYEDLIVYQGKLYAIKVGYELILVELSPEPRKTSCNIAPPPIEWKKDYSYTSNLYLVESQGELLVVSRVCKDNSTSDDIFSVVCSDEVTYMFKVYKLDQHHRCWIKVEDLGDQVLFIGTSGSVSLLTFDYPEFKRNSIYFAADYFPMPTSEDKKASWVVGVFHLEDDSSESLFPNDSHSHLSPPLWFTPAYCW